MFFIGERVKTFREQQGLTKLELSRRSGLSDSHISQIEKFKKMPTLPTIEKLAIGLSKEVSELIGVHYIGLNIQNIRSQRGLTMRELEIISNLSKGHICKIEKGVRRKPTQETLIKIANALHVPLATLLLTHIQTDLAA